MFNILSSFYSFLLQEQIVQVNPFSLIRQKSKFLQKEAKSPVIRRLSNEQWETVINVAKDKAAQNPPHKRTIFILSCLFGMYLRISELAASPWWTPTIDDFFKDTEGHWWFKMIGKGNKTRQIAVSDAMLSVLKYYRKKYLKLPPFPILMKRHP